VDKAARLISVTNASILGSFRESNVLNSCNSARRMSIDAAFDTRMSVRDAQYEPVEALLASFKTSRANDLSATSLYNGDDSLFSYDTKRTKKRIRSRREGSSELHAAETILVKKDSLAAKNRFN
jgi:hypothetical protein